VLNFFSFKKDDEDSNEQDEDSKEEDEDINMFILFLDFFFHF